LPWVHWCPSCLFPVDYTKPTTITCNTFSCSEYACDVRSHLDVVWYHYLSNPTSCRCLHSLTTMSLPPFPVLFVGFVANKTLSS
jgi:hypothetical protein